MRLAEPIRKPARFVLTLVKLDCRRTAQKFFGMPLVKSYCFLAILCVSFLNGRIILAADPKPESKGLLVGCTRYDFNPERSLRGPINDVALMHELLMDRFGFKAENIRKLVEGGTPADRPTRANIAREIESLIRDAKPGQQIVLFFAGHGCQQPDQTPSDPNDPEPDGLDEVFLPADIGPWTSEIQSIRNAIVDDEFRKWTAQLLERRVELLVIFDSCHSGSGLRGAEVARHLDPEELVPKEVLTAARGRGSRSPFAASAEPAFDPLSRGNWVAIYAAQPEETTVETKLPKPSANGRPHGLLTYTLCRTLRDGAIPSYREAIQRVRAEYMAHGRYAPTPLVEGQDLDRRILGAERLKPSFLLERDQGGWIVRAGPLHGLTVGSILAVTPIRAATDSSPVGHVKVTETGLEKSSVTPCEYGDQKLNVELPIGGVCRLVLADYGDFRLRVALEDDVARGEGNDHTSSLKALAAKQDSPITIVEDFESADWFISRDPESRSNGWILSPRSTYQQPRGLADSKELQIRLALNGANPESVEESLRRLNRATNLLSLAARLGSTDPDGVSIHLDLLYRAPDWKEPALLPIDRLPTLVPGGTVTIRVTNTGRESVDFTLLFVDSQYGIVSVFPRKYANVDNRLTSGKCIETKALQVTDGTVGREHLVLIAVPSDRERINFAFLAQPNLARADAERSQIRGNRLTSSFEKLLETAAWGGDTRSLGQSVKTPAVQTRSWVVERATKSPK